LERARPDRDLHAIDVRAACEVVAGLYGRLHRSPLPQLRKLSELCLEWANRLPPLAESNLVPRRFISQADRLLHDFASDPATDSALIHSDLHFANVLAADREPWLVIDPKPLAAEREFAVAPIVRSGELGHSKRDVLYRLDRLCAELDLDRERARGWTIVQTMAWMEGDGAPERTEVVEWLL